MSIIIYGHTCAIVHTLVHACMCMHTYVHLRDIK